MGFVEWSFIRSNRGLYALQYIVGSLNRYLTSKEKLNINSSVSERIIEFEPYLEYLLNTLSDLALKNDDPYDILKVQGQAAERTWSMTFERIISKKFNGFMTDELIEFEETQDKQLQKEAKEYLDELERLIKKVTLNQMEDIFGDVWDLEISAIKKSCQNRAEDEKERIYKTEGIKKQINWTDMFNILDYHSMAVSNWTKEGEQKKITFQNLFSLNTEEYIFNQGEEVFELGSISNKKSIDWFKKINNYRNSIAHSGSKSYRLIKKEVKFIKDILIILKSQINTKIVE